MNHIDLPRLNAKDLEPWWKKKEILKLCCNQLEKDLAPYNIILDFKDEKLSYEVLFSALRIKLNTLYEQPALVREILYRIDVPESWIYKVAMEHESLLDSITRLIIWRELQKIVTKLILSQTFDQNEGDY